jgi:hypothetical protein
MPITIDGNGTIGGLTAGGLPDGTVTRDDLATTAKGSILQVVQSTKTDHVSFASQSYANSGLTVTLTPSSSSSKILCLAQVNVSWDYTESKAGVSLFRDSTKLHFGDAYGTRSRDTHYIYLGTNNFSPWPLPITYLDTPNTTSSVEYTVKIRKLDPNGTIYLNRATDVYDNTVIFSTTASSLICMEVAA